jgi:hypothetical protein
MRVSASEELAALLGEVVLVSPAHAGISNTQRSYTGIPIRELSSHFLWPKSLRVGPGSIRANQSLTGCCATRHPRAPAVSKVTIRENQGFFVALDSSYHIAAHWKSQLPTY